MGARRPRGCDRGQKFLVCRILGKNRASSRTRPLRSCEVDDTLWSVVMVKANRTLLQAVAARRVGSVPEACAVHYVHPGHSIIFRTGGIHDRWTWFLRRMWRDVCCWMIEAINSKLKDASPSRSGFINKRTAEDAADWRRLEAFPSRREARRRVAAEFGLLRGVASRKMRELMEAGACARFWLGVVAAGCVVVG